VKHERPEVTVVVPCFNQVRFLAECLASVIEQTLTRWEAVVVDDASTEDGMDDVISALGDPRVRSVRHEVNRGLAAARNTGFRAAGADLILPLDSDDRLHREFLSTTVSALLANEEADCVFTDWQLFGAIDGIWAWEGPYGFPAMTVAQTIPGTGVLMRREVWDRAGGYVEASELLSGNEDWDFWLAATPGLHPLRIQSPLYFYRRHQDSMSAHSLQWNDHSQREFIYRRHQAIFDRYDTGNAFRAAGYLNSAARSWSTGHRRRALRVASCALRSRGLTLSFSRLAARSISLSVARSGVRHLRAGLDSARALAGGSRR